MTFYYDIAMISDLRLRGGNALSIAEEIRSQHKAGYTTALLHLPAIRKPRRRHQVDPALREAVRRGMAELRWLDEPIHAGLVSLRLPGILSADPPLSPKLEAQTGVIIANSPPAADLSSAAFKPYEVADRARAIFGRDLPWAPISPVIRDQLRQAWEELALLPEDWHNIIDPDDWFVDRAVPCSDRPVIGRHSRPERAKWPSDRDVLLQAYPDDPSYRVKLMGGELCVRTQFPSGPPDNWDVLPFNSESPTRFLSQIDFFVYYHHPDWTEAFGRAILEALASGAVTILPPYMESLYGDAALYATPREVRGIVDAYYADWDLYCSQSDSAMSYVKTHFSHDTHGRRLHALVGQPSRGAAGRGDDSKLSHISRPRVQRPKIAFIPGNGHGLGHLIRTLSVARNLTGDVDTCFLSLSENYQLLEESGFDAEYFPSAVAFDTTGPAWTSAFRARLDAFLTLHRPRVVVYDGSMPYMALDQLGHSRVPHRVWLRRGLWPDESTTRALEREYLFDHVLEPADMGDTHPNPTTVQGSTPAKDVPPIVSLHPDEFLDARTARCALGLPPNGICILIQLAHPDASILFQLVHAIAEIVRRSDSDATICIPASLTHHCTLGVRVNAHSVRVFPLARYLLAFDAAISAAGYNSFHELLYACVPTLFIPKLTTRFDSQLDRARNAARRGLALYASPEDMHSVASAVEQIMQRGERERIARHLAESPRPNGAQQAAVYLEGLATDCERASC